MLGTEMVVVLLLHCAKHCPEIVGVQYYIAYCLLTLIFVPPLLVQNITINDGWYISFGTRELFFCTIGPASYKT